MATDEQQASGGEATAEAQAPASVSPEQPPSFEGFDFDTAFGTGLALNGAAATAEPSATEPPAQSSERSESKPGDDEASDDEPPTEGEQPPAEGAEPKLSRRQQAEQARQAELAETRKRAEAAEARVQEIERQYAAEEQRRVEARAAVMAKLGPEDEFARLNATPSLDLSPEDQDKLDGWKKARLEAGPVMDLLLELTHAEAALAAPEFGLEAEQVKRTLQSGRLKGLMQLAAQSAEQRTRAEFEPQVADLKDTITQLETELKDLRTKRAASSRQPELGGASTPAVVPNGRPTFDPTQAAEANFRAAFG